MRRRSHPRCFISRSAPTPCGLISPALRDRFVGTLARTATLDVFAGIPKNQGNTLSRLHMSIFNTATPFALLFLMVSITACATHDQARTPAESGAAAPTDDEVVGTTPADDLPHHISKLTNFGERAEWSHDGRRILFVEKTFGDVYQIELETREISLLTGHFYHEGFLRAMYLSNGDVLLFGPPKYDPEDPYKSRWRDSQLWVLDQNFDKPPVPLGTEVFEGAAVSRTRLRLVWMIGHADYYDTDDLLEPRNLPYGTAQFWMATIDYSSAEPRLADKKMVLDTRDLSFEADIEPQNFRRPDERELIFSAYRFNAIEEMGKNAEVMGLDLESGEVTNYSNSPAYEEPEGIFPDGDHTLVESDRHGGGGDRYIDLYKLKLDSSGDMERLTFFSDMRGYKASNPVVSDDGRYIAFQMARSTDMPGVGRGLFLYDISRAPK